MPLTSNDGANTHSNHQPVTASLMLKILDKLEPKVIYMLYSKIAMEVRDRLAQSGMLPDVSQIEAKSRQADHYQGHHHGSSQSYSLEHPPLKQIIMKLIKFVITHTDYGNITSSNGSPARV